MAFFLLESEVHNIQYMVRNNTIKEWEHFAIGSSGKVCTAFIYILLHIANELQRTSNYNERKSQNTTETSQLMTDIYGREILQN